MINKKVYSPNDFRALASKKLPKFVMGFIDGGSGDESTLKANVDNFSNINLLPALNEQTQDIALDCNVLGHQYSAPFGIASMGLCGLIHPKAELILARQAAQFNVPYVLSSASNISIGEITDKVGIAPWFQLYIPKAKSQLDVLLDLANKNECPVLMITLDAPVPGIRWRDRKNGLNLPYKFNLNNVVESVLHPKWSLSHVKAGKLSFPNYNNLMEENPKLKFSDLMKLQTGGLLNWSVLKEIRSKWRKKIILKGIMTTSEAEKAKALGVDAVIISNHGGRQLNSAPASISVLPSFVDAGFSKEFLMLDSGLRSGEDVIKTLASGAAFTFFGRPLLYALAAQGEKGVETLLTSYFEELNVNLQLIGVNTPSQLNHRNIMV